MSEHYDSFKFTHEGREFLACLYYDSDAGRPWEREDGHGPVREGSRNYHGIEKRAGELVLHEGGRNEYSWVYDYAEAMRIAKREQWGTGEHGPAEGETLAQYRHRVVMADFEYLRGWCNDHWHYCGVGVRLLDDKGEPVGDEFEHALWGIESNAGDYLREVAAELADEFTPERWHYGCPMNETYITLNGVTVSRSKNLRGLLRYRSWVKKVETRIDPVNSHRGELRVTYSEGAQGFATFNSYGIMIDWVRNRRAWRSQGATITHSGPDMGYFTKPGTIAGV
jgi:hypothetical protein